MTLDKVPSNEELRKIMMHLPVQGKALYLTLASSGMRMGEAVQLTLEDLDLDSDPCRVNIRGEYTKTGNPRIAFISREAREAVYEWLKVHDEYLEAAANRSMYEKDPEDPRIFPFTGANARLMWNNALEKAGYSGKDRQTNMHKLHPHVLRKFFRTKLGALIPVDVVEALMGHEGYLTEVYRRYSREQLAEFYKQGEHALLAFTEASEVSRLRREVETQKEQLQTLVNGLTAENMELRQTVKDLETRFDKTEKKLEHNKERVEKLEKLADILMKTTKEREG